MDSYEVFFRDTSSDYRWSVMFRAVSFAEAEKKALENLNDAFSEIINITKDFKND